jgi:hypothetical protein
MLMKLLSTSFNNHAPQSIQIHSVSPFPPNRHGNPTSISGSSAVVVVWRDSGKTEILIYPRAGIGDLPANFFGEQEIEGGRALSNP